TVNLAPAELRKDGSGLDLATTTETPYTQPMISTTIAGTGIYARISEDRQNGAGVDRQVEDCLAAAGDRGWRLVAPPFVDNDISPRAHPGRRRPHCRGLRAAVRAGTIQRVIVGPLDRLYRQPKELEELIDLADAGRVEIVSVTGGDVDLGTSDGRLVARML